MTTKQWAATNNKGRALIEYAVLIIIILAALYWMKNPIWRAFNGRLKTVGDSFAFGRQYAPKATRECGHYKLLDDTWVWADERCFDAKRVACDTLTDESAVAACEAGAVQQCTGGCEEANDNPYY